METIVVRNNKQRMLMSGYLSILGLLILSSVFVIPFVVLYMMDNGLAVDPNQATQDLLIPGLFLTFLSEGLLILLVLWFTGNLRNWRATLGLENFNWRTLLIGPAIGVAFFLGLMGLTALANLAGVDVADSDTSAQFTQLSGWLKIVVLFVCVPILAPIFEELLFRGLILNHLLRGHGAEDKPLRAPIVVWCITYSSLCFSLAHFQGASSLIDFVVLAWTFLFAVAACVLRIKARSIYPSMAAHGVYNGASAVGLYFS